MMSTGALNSLSNKGWVKLLIETVEVPVEQDESLLLSTVQSVIPGAHGLYTRENGQRRALTLDTTTGRVQGPQGGWTAEDIYVHIAHGHKHGMNCNMGGEYTKASEIFEKNVTAVQKLIAASGLGYAGLRKLDSKNSPKRATRVKSGFEAQPEEVHISDESDSYLQAQLDQKQKELVKVTEEKEELVLRLKEVEGELSDQQKENDNLRNALNDALNQPAPEIIQETVQPQSSSSGKKKKGKSVHKESSPAKEDAKESTIKQLQNELETVILKNAQLTDEVLLLRGKPNAGPSMDESGFVESHSDGEDSSRSAEQVKELGVQLEAAQKKCIDWEAQAESLQLELWSEREQHDYKILELTEKEEEMNNLHSVIEELRSKLSALEKERNDLEWHIGEHKEWLKNSNDKVSYLEAELQRGIPAPVKPEEIKELEVEKARQNEQIWLAHEKIAQLEQTITDLQLNLTNTHEKLRDALEKEDLLKKVQEDKDKLQWKIGELTQWWNDAKWKVGELESGYDHQKFLLQMANERINKLSDDDAVETEKETSAPTTTLSGGGAAFSVRKQPGSERWQLATSSWQDAPSTAFPSPFAYPAPQLPYAYPTPYPAVYPTAAYPTTFLPPQPQFVNSTENRRVWFEVEAPNAKNVFLAGSFLNWEVALLCRPGPNGKHGVWVDLPRGKYEFKFMVEGQWQTTSNYPVSTNEIGSMNNYRFVE